MKPRTEVKISQGIGGRHQSQVATFGEAHCQLKYSSRSGAGPVAPHLVDGRVEFRCRMRPLALVERRGPFRLRYGPRNASARWPVASETGRATTMGGATTALAAADDRCLISDGSPLRGRIGMARRFRRGCGPGDGWLFGHARARIVVFAAVVAVRSVVPVSLLISMVRRVSTRTVDCCHRARASDF